MELMKLVSEKMTYTKSVTQAIFFTASVVYIIADHIWLDSKDMNHVGLFLTHIFMIIIIYLWVYYAPKMIDRMQEVQIAFNTKAYKKAYKRYEENCSLFSKNMIIKKIMFFLFWAGFIILYLYALPVLSIVNYGVFIRQMTGFIVFIALGLNSISCFECISYTLFLRQVSKLNIEETVKLEHNVYLPSTSSGFGVLVRFAEQNAMVYFIVSLLFILSYSINIGIPCFMTNVNTQIQQYFLLVITFITTILGIVTLLIIYLGPLFFLQRIHNKWKINQLIILEGLLIDCQNNDNSKVLDLIERLSKDKVRYKYNLLAIIGLILSLMLSGLNIIGFFFK